MQRDEIADGQQEGGAAHDDHDRPAEPRVAQPLGDPRGGDRDTQRGEEREHRLQLVVIERPEWRVCARQVHDDQERRARNGVDACGRQSKQPKHGKRQEYHAPTVPHVVPDLAQPRHQFARQRRDGMRPHHLALLGVEALHVRREGSLGRGRSSGVQPEASRHAEVEVLTRIERVRCEAPVARRAVIPQRNDPDDHSPERSRQPEIPPAAARVERPPRRPVSYQSSNAHQPSSHRAPVVTSEKYDARKKTTRGAVVQKNHAPAATHGPAPRRARAKHSAPVSPLKSTGMRPGSPNQTPGTMSSAWPGQYLAANTGVTMTWYCSKNSGSGGPGAVQRPEAKRPAWSR